MGFHLFLLSNVSAEECRTVKKYEKINGYKKNPGHDTRCHKDRQYPTNYVYCTVLLVMIPLNLYEKGIF